ncbi:MAG: (2Fe-2S)-binding protein [Chloroflexi bacterium]|nr:(2Fe-2S)-binding protein [Chloroflexota bacterium]
MPDKPSADDREVDATGEPTAGEVTSFDLTVNGRHHEVRAAWLGESLLYVLRERLGLYGSKNACEQGECGSCSILLDGALVCACCVLAVDAAGSTITTVEGLAPDTQLTDVQQHLVEQGGVQCGFCTPGFVVAIHDLLARRPTASPIEVREALSGNLCRCTGYGRILAAVRSVQEERLRASS